MEDMTYGLGHVQSPARAATHTNTHTMTTVTAISWVSHETADIKTQQNTCNGQRKEEARPLTDISAPCFRQCSNTTGWMTGRHLACKSALHIPKSFLREQVEVENWGKLAISGSPGNGR